MLGVKGQHRLSRQPQLCSGQMPMAATATGRHQGGKPMALIPAQSIDSECGACALWLGGEDLWLVMSGYIHRLLRLRIQLATPHRGHRTSLFLCQLGSINKNAFSCYFIFLLFLVAYILKNKNPSCLEQHVLPRKFIIYVQLTSHPFYQHCKVGAVLSLLGKGACRERQGEGSGADLLELWPLRQGEDTQR